MLREAFEAAVVKRMMSDVPFGEAAAQLLFVRFPVRLQSVFPAASAAVMPADSEHKSSIFDCLRMRCLQGMLHPGGLSIGQFAMAVPHSKATEALLQVS